MWLLSLLCGIAFLKEQLDDSVSFYQDETPHFSTSVIFPHSIYFKIVSREQKGIFVKAYVILSGAKLLSS